ncbi:hypothetical protein [Salinivibrio sp. ML290]|uniref:hypothetical protein n=1 Tax=Salinivibrio sp. ML290 TaxID=1909468 RepID=UPI0009887AC9|nr:hypothetical protein [Salinivibrio sp. ML290]OOE77101.1 hypothetical protein BZG23_01875 [Salinivibrio sp. ML290]
MSLQILKKELESALLITSWSPSDADLKEIATKLREFEGQPNKGNISRIVLSVVGSYESMLLEGVDNSDLTTLLLLATKTDASDDE